MNGWHLRWRPDSPEGPPALIDGASLQPEALAKLSEREVLALPIRTGRSLAFLRDLFECFPLGPDPGPPRLVVDGSPRFTRLAWRMARGVVEVDGDAGILAGAGMRGGSLIVHGNAGPLAGAGLRGGTLRIEGDAGASLGGPLPGEAVGSRGGEILVLGNAGDEAAAGLHGGLVVVAGRAGAIAGRAMAGGIVLVLGGALDSPALEMRGGTLVALGGWTGSLPGFRRTGSLRWSWLRLLARRLRELDFPIPPEAQAEMAGNAALEGWSGDGLVQGRGEVLVAPAG